MYKRIKIIIISWIIRYPRTPCRLVASCFKSQCLQKYSYHRLLSYDPCDSSRGLHIDVFRLPISCSCYAPEFQGFDHFEHLLIDDDDKDDEDKWWSTLCFEHLLSIYIKRQEPRSNWKRSSTINLSSFQRFDFLEVIFKAVKYNNCQFNRYR